MVVLTVLLVWIAVSIPLAFLVARFLAGTERGRGSERLLVELVAALDEVLDDPEVATDADAPVSAEVGTEAEVAEDPEAAPVASIDAVAEEDELVIDVTDGPDVVIDVSDGGVSLADAGEEPGR